MTSRTTPHLGLSQFVKKENAHTILNEITEDNEKIDAAYRNLSNEFFNAVDNFTEQVNTINQNFTDQVNDLDERFQEVLDGFDENNRILAISGVPATIDIAPGQAKVYNISATLYNPETEVLVDNGAIHCTFTTTELRVRCDGNGVVNTTVNVSYTVGQTTGTIAVTIKKYQYSISQIALRNSPKVFAGRTLTNSQTNAININDLQEFGFIITYVKDDVDTIPGYEPYVISEDASQVNYNSSYNIQQHRNTELIYYGNVVGSFGYARNEADIGSSALGDLLIMCSSQNGSIQNNVVFSVVQ